MEKDLTRFSFFRNDDVQDKIDALSIFGGSLIRELTETLPNRLCADDEKHRNAFDEVIVKLGHLYTPWVNPKSTRPKLDKIKQNEGETLAQYYVRVRLQASKCQFANAENDIHSKFLFTMRDGKLRLEAMVKSY